MPAEPTGTAPAPDPQMAKALGRDRRRVVLSYLLLALAWMIATDGAMAALVPPVETRRTPSACAATW